MRLKKNIVNRFNSFLRIKDYKNPPKTKIKRYAFLLKYIVENKYLTVNNFQFCSTYISKELGVSVTIVRKWIKQLQESRILVCTNPKYKIGSRSKEYTLTDFGREIVNELNGYNKSSKKHQVKKEHRTKKWSEALSKLATNRSKKDLIGMLGIIDRIAIPKKRYFAAIIEKQIIGR